MGLIATAYDNDEYGENRLLFWLRHDTWSVHQAAMIIADVNPDKSDFDKNFNFRYLQTFKGEEFPDCDSNGFPIVQDEDDMGNIYYVGGNKLKWFSQRYNDIRSIFFNSDCNEFMSPSYWINKAISKRIVIPWLDHVITRELFAYDVDVNGNKFLRFVDGLDFVVAKQVEDKTVLFTNDSNYPIELDFALKAWQAVTTTKGKGKPKARIRKWLDENTDLSNAAKKRISIVANWDKTGGATRSD